MDQIDQQLGTLPAGVNRYQYASCYWAFEKIRQGGGLGIFCHPYWFTRHRYSPAGALTSHLLETQPFDAYELLGGYDRPEIDSNTLQVARYYEERLRAMKYQLWVSVTPMVAKLDRYLVGTIRLFFRLPWNTRIWQPVSKTSFQSQLRLSPANLSEPMAPFDSSSTLSSFYVKYCRSRIRSAWKRAG